MQSNQCLLCQRNLLLGPSGGICRAFPLGIPPEILGGAFDHSAVHPEQFNKTILKIEEGEKLPEDFTKFPQAEDFPGGKMKAPGEEAPEFPPYKVEGSDSLF